MDSGDNNTPSDDSNAEQGVGCKEAIGVMVVCALFSGVLAVVADKGIQFYSDQKNFENRGADFLVKFGFLFASSLLTVGCMIVETPSLNRLIFSHANEAEAEAEARDIAEVGI